MSFLYAADICIMVSEFILVNSIMKNYSFINVFLEFFQNPQNRSFRKQYSASVFLVVVVDNYYVGLQLYFILSYQWVFLDHFSINKQPSNIFSPKMFYTKVINSSKKCSRNVQKCSEQLTFSVDISVSIIGQEICSVPLQMEYHLIIYKDNVTDNHHEQCSSRYRFKVLRAY